MASRMLVRSGASLRPIAFSAPRTLSRRTFTQTSYRALKESESSDPNGAEFEKHKQDSVKKQKEGKGHWKPELASVSEESVKADRLSPKEFTKDAVKELQEKTKGHADETHKSGTSMRDGL